MSTTAGTHICAGVGLQFNGGVLLRLPFLGLPFQHELVFVEEEGQQPVVAEADLPPPLDPDRATNPTLGVPEELEPLALLLVLPPALPSSPPRLHVKGYFHRLPVLGVALQEETDGRLKDQCRALLGAEARP